MKLEGGCYCGKVRYVAEGKPMLKVQCHCRECQYISGDAPNLFLLTPPDEAETAVFIFCRRLNLKVRIRPLAVGKFKFKFKFKGDLHSDTAQGVIVSE